MKLTAPLYGAKEGEVYPTWFAPGDECPPELEAAAREQGALDRKDKRDKKAEELV